MVWIPDCRAPVSRRRLLIGALSIFFASRALAGNLDLGARWVFPLRDSGDTSPAIGKDGAIYFGTFDGKFWAVTSSGEREWVFESRRVARANMEIRSSPALSDDGDVYFGCRDGRLYALSTEGKLKWAFDTGGWVDSSPAIGKDGTVYVGSWDKNLYAIGKAGREKWRFATGAVVTSSPALDASGRIYFGSHDGKLYAVLPDGSKAWAYDTGAQITSSPAIGPDGVVYITSVNGFLHAVTPEGAMKWRLKTGGITQSSPSIAEDSTVYLGVNDRIWAVSAAGEKQWSQHVPGDGEVRSSPVILKDKTVLVISTFGTLTQFQDEKTFKGLHYTYGYISATPAVGIDGTVYMVSGIKNSRYGLVALTNRVLVANEGWPKFRANLRNNGRR